MPHSRPRLALRVGITGHRWREAHHAPNERLDIGNAGAVRSALRLVLQRIKSAVHETHRGHADAFTEDQPVLSLVSALAEGADELAASVALEPAVGYVLDIVAPYDLAAHSPRFAEGGYPHELWTAARSRLVLDGVPLADEPPVPPMPLVSRAMAAATGAPPAPLTPSGVRHEATLIETNRRLMWNSDVIIAVWDGHDARGEAGTARVIARARADGLPVIHIHSVHPSRIALLEGRSTEEWMTGVDAVVRRLIAPPARDASAGRSALAEYAPEEPLDTTSPWQPIVGADAVSVGRDTILAPEFRRANELAATYRARHQATLATIVFAAPFAVVCAWLASRASGRATVWYGLAELGLLLLMTICFVRRRYRGFHERSIDSRLLAERLRHHGFLWPLGRTSPVVRVPIGDASTEQRTAWVNWRYRAVARALGVADITLDASTLRAIIEDERAQLIDTQLTHDRAARTRAHRSELSLQGPAWILLLLAIGAAGAQTLDEVGAWHLPESFAPWLNGLSVLGPLFGATLYAVATQTANQDPIVRADTSTQQLEQFAAQFAAIDVTEPLVSKRIGDLTLELTDVLGERLPGWRADNLSRRGNPPG